LGVVRATWIPGQPMIETEVLRIWFPPEEKARMILQLGWAELPPEVTLEQFARTVSPYWDIPQERLKAALLPILTVPGWEALTIEVHALGAPPKLYHTIAIRPR